MHECSTSKWERWREGGNSDGGDGLLLSLLSLFTLRFYLQQHNILNSSGLRKSKTATYSNQGIIHICIRPEWKTSINYNTSYQIIFALYLGDCFNYTDRETTLVDGCDNQLSSTTTSGVLAPNVSLYTWYEWKRVTLGTALSQLLKAFFFIFHRSVDQPYEIAFLSWRRTTWALGSTPPSRPSAALLSWCRWH